MPDYQMQMIESFGVKMNCRFLPQQNSSTQTLMLVMPDLAQFDNNHCFLIHFLIETSPKLLAMLNLNSDRLINYSELKVIKSEFQVSMNFRFCVYTVALNIKVILFVLY